MKFSISSQQKKVLKYYRISENYYRKRKFEKLEDWMIFFEVIGKYVMRKNEINLMISYIDEVLPSLFITKGILEEYYLNSNYYLNDDKENYLKIGDQVTFLYDVKKEEWRKAIVEDIYNNEIMTEFNPYVNLKIKLGKNTNINHNIPYNQWNQRIRNTENFKSTAGTKVKINDYISDYLLENYGQEIINNIKMCNKNIINLIGFNIEKIINEYIEIIEFRQNDCNYSLKDIIYFNNINNGYSNTRIIKSNKFKLEANSSEISIFLGDNSSLTFADFKSNKNIFISNRKKNNNLYNDIFTDNFLTESFSNTPELVTKEINRLLKKEGVEIPKGVEIYGF